ncbi:MAG: hypothetical protein PHF86_05510 [Candidatus Nanoarchaeia archaeon]|nr:hypothetical protein [Candidatus Nanoarchaeia archaeon]
MKKIILLIVLILSVSIVYAQGELISQLVPGGLIPNPQAELYNVLSQNQQFQEFFKAINYAQTTQSAITDPGSFIASQVGGEFIKSNPEYQPLFQASSQFMSYAEQSAINDYNLQLNNEGTIKTGEINYENTDVIVKGVEADSNGKFSCAEENCELTVGKNTYTGIEKDKSNLVLDNNGKLTNAEFIVNKPTQMYLGDRIFTVQPGTNLNYTLKKDTQGNEYYEVVIKSESKEGVNVDFPTLDEQGNPSELKNYKISSGSVKVTSKGIEVYKGTSIEDLKLKYQLTNNGNNPVLITSNRNNLPKNNYLLANSKEFEFNLQQSDINIKEGNPWGLNVPVGESLKIGIQKQGSGYLGSLNVDANGKVQLGKVTQGLNTNLINTAGEFEVTNCNSKKLVTSTEVIEKSQGFGQSCIGIDLVTNTKNLNNLVIDYNEGIEICSVSNQLTTGSFIEVSGRQVVSTPRVTSTPRTTQRVASTPRTAGCTQGISKIKGAREYDDAYTQCGIESTCATQKCKQDIYACRGELLDSCKNQLSSTKQPFTLDDCIRGLGGKSKDGLTRCNPANKDSNGRYTDCPEGYVCNINVCSIPKLPSAPVQPLTSAQLISCNHPYVIKINSYLHIPLTDKNCQEIITYLSDIIVRSKAGNENNLLYTSTGTGVLIDCKKWSKSVGLLAGAEPGHCVIKYEGGKLSGQSCINNDLYSQKC